MPTHGEFRLEVEAIERHPRYDEFIELCRQAALAQDRPNLSEADAARANSFEAECDVLQQEIEREICGKHRGRPLSGTRR